MFDYIIVGGGSAGCVLANRLSADPAVQVLLLEAGPEDSIPEIHMPAAWMQLQGTPVDWAFSCDPCDNLHARCVPWPRGRVLGGSSSINAMIYIRGAREDYDQWSELGNPGWSYDEVLPYFLRSENQERGLSPHHGVGGPLNVADLRCVSPLSQAFVEGCSRTGIPRNDDFNGASQLGAGLFQVTQKDGRRCSAAVAYLHPVRHRANLTVAVNARATRVVIRNARAAGVEYLSGTEPKFAEAVGEVILAGGALGSPHLLMLSGIGPAKELAAAGVPCVLDLPGVGGNLQDHPIAAVSHRCSEPVSAFGADSAENLELFMRDAQGPLTSNGAEAGAFLKTAPGLRVPDLQYHFLPIGFTVPAIGVDGPLTTADFHSFAIAVTLLHCKSRGQLKLRSADPAVPPAIQSGYLADRADLDTAIHGIRIAREVVDSGAFERYGVEEYSPGRALQSDAELENFVRHVLWTCFHPVGTCKMGNDEMSVVDPQLRVRGVEGLRVVDASIMPEIVSGNTNAPTIMIAERAAAMITGRELAAGA